MAGISLADAEAKLQSYLDAEEAILTGQEYQIGGRKLRRADLASIQNGIKIWDERVKRLSRGGGGGIRITGAVSL